MYETMTLRPLTHSQYTSFVLHRLKFTEFNFVCDNEMSEGV